MSRRLSILLLALLGGCSSLAEPPVKEACEKDPDCDTGQWCALEQGGVCVDKRKPQRGAFALRIEDEDLQVELTGCATVEKRGSVLEAQLARPQLETQFQLEVLPVFGRGLDPDVAVPACALENEWEWDERGFCRSPQRDQQAQLSLSRRSLLGLESLAVAKPVDEASDPPFATGFEWPTNNPFRPVLEVLPVINTEASYARVYYGLNWLDEALTSGTTTVLSDSWCHWPVTSRVRRMRATEGEATNHLAGAEVKLLYTSQITPITVVPEPPLELPEAEMCRTNLDCGTDLTGQICNAATGHCGLDLEGALAASDTSTNEPDSLGDVSFVVYGYCYPDWRNLRTLDVQVDPGVEADLPSIRLEANLKVEEPELDDINPFLDPVELEPNKDICLPNWKRDAFTIATDYSSYPVRLRLGSKQFDCCDTSCFTEPDAYGDDDANKTCNTLPAGASIRFQTTLTRETDPMPDFENDYCLRFKEDEEDSTIGEYEKKLDCEQSPCPLTLAQPYGTVDPRKYRIIVLHTESSVYRSVRREIFLPLEPGAELNLSFLPRAVLQGRVICAASSTGCDAGGALVMAERLRLEAADHPEGDGEDDDQDDEREDPLGPYFYRQTTDATGNFALPVNPGVYIVTALPKPSTVGGPAPYKIFDLRLDDQGGPLPAADWPPTADIGEELALGPGSAVRVKLNGFSKRASVTPWDYGSWRAQSWETESGFALIPGVSEFLPAVPDLNDLQTCYHPVGKRLGCRIRRIVDGSLSLTQTGKLQFTGRSTNGPVACPDDSPGQIP